MGHYIVPVVGLVCGQNEELENTHEIVENLKPNPDEVHSVFSIPLSYLSSNLNSNQVFSLMHEPFGRIDSFKSKLINELKDEIPTDFYRLFINFNKTVFNPSTDTYPFVYGFNAFMLLAMILLVENNLEMLSKITLSRVNIVNFIDNIRKCSFLFYLKELNKNSKL